MVTVRPTTLYDPFGFQQQEKLLIEQVGFILTTIGEKEPIWSWFIGVSEQVLNAYPLFYEETNYVMLGQMLFTEPINEDHGYMMGLYYEGEDQGMLAVWDGPSGFDNTIAFLPEQIPERKEDGWITKKETPAFMGDDLRVLTPEVGAWEDNAGGLDWQWGSHMDFDKNAWKIWNYGTSGEEWAEGQYLVLFGQSNGVYDGGYIFNATMTLGASALAVTAMGIAAIAATLF
jgi:hypothetical protein